MRHSFHNWLDTLPFSDFLERRLAGLFQITLLIILAGSLVGLPLGMATDGRVDFIVYPLLMVCCGIALAWLRRGKITSAVYLTTIGMIAALSLQFFVSGLVNSPDTLVALAIPITLGSLILGRRGLVRIFGLIVLLLVLLAVFEAFTTGIVASMPMKLSPIAVGVWVAVFLCVLCLLLDRFSDALRAALVAAQMREQELERLRGSLEATVAERTAALQQALADVEQREAHLVKALEDLQTSQNVILELSAPVIPVLAGVLVVPLIGALDGRRTASLTQNVLAAVAREHAREVILDVTGVPLIDTQGAQVLIETTVAVRLLGAKIVLVGVQPEVAQTIVSLGIDLGVIRTYASLRDAIIVKGRTGFTPSQGRVET